MSHINPNVLFQSGFSEPRKMETNEIDKYLKSFTALTTQVREDFAVKKNLPIDGISIDNVLLSTTVEAGRNSKYIMENCGNMLKILESSKDHSHQLDERTLAKLNALLEAAIEHRLEAIYIEPDRGEQELIILSHFGSGDSPRTTSIRAAFAEADVTSVQEFSDDYKGKVQQLEKFWVNPTTQDVEGKDAEKINDEAVVPELKTNRLGNAADEIQGAINHEKVYRDERGRIEDAANKCRLEEERIKDQQDNITDRNKAFSDRKQTSKLDQASQRAHGQEVDKTID